MAAGSPAASLGEVASALGATLIGDASLPVRGLAPLDAAGPGEMPAAMIAGILPLEFLVHAWDYATAVGRAVDAPDDLAEYVLGLTKAAVSEYNARRTGEKYLVTPNG